MPEFIFTPGEYNSTAVNLTHFINGKYNYMLFSIGTESDLGVLTGAFRLFEASVGGIK